MKRGTYKRTKKIREKQSKALKGKKKPPFSEEHKRKLIENHKGMIGKKHSKETREKMSLAHIGRPHSKEWNKKVGESLKGRRRPKELREKLSGKNHWNWKGGITPENEEIRNSIEYRLWREVVFARDNWTCQKCEQKGGKLIAHHIQNFNQYPELRFAIDNGITFCIKCHREFHKQYGKQNNTREQIIKFLNNK